VCAIIGLSLARHLLPLITQAAADAQTYYEQLLNALGIAEVRVIVRGYSS